MERERLVKKRAGESFSDRAKKYGASADHIAGGDLDYIKMFLEGKDIDVALDVSTGAGHTAGLLKMHCTRVLAVDIALGMLAEARERYAGGSISFVGGDAEHLPFLPERFSLVTCRIAPHHFLDVPSFLGEVERVLRGGSFFILIDSTVPEDSLLDGFLNMMEKTRDETHIRSLRVSDWERFLGEAGFRIIDRKVFRKKHDFRPWLERTNPTKRQKKDLIEMIKKAEEKILEYFQFEFRDGEVLAYTDDKTLFLSVKE
jgi:ubiquinone/menaquinone biosynthesis C-methylase UbiE